MPGGVISAVEPGSIADQLGLAPGDVLESINGRPLRDVLDVHFYAAEESLDLIVRRGDVEMHHWVERDYETPLGLDFEAPTFDPMRLCHNGCEFCFVAQMPPRKFGLRPSLYLRDDDYRYSVLYGSFITLTNLTEDDWQRIKEQRLSPLYISVHATDPALRRRLLGQDNVPDILPQLDRLAALGIELHTQLVLTPGVNDGEHLRRSIDDLAARFPAVQSIGVVPVGLTRYHRGVCRPYAPAQAGAVIEQLAPLQKQFRRQFNLSLVYLSDEWYLKAGLPVPPDRHYDGYPQIENGIGLVRRFLKDSRALDTSSALRVTRITLVCGTLFAQTLQQEAIKLSNKIGVHFEIVPVVNQLFGETVTVSGLLGGREVIAALQAHPLGDMVCLPRAMFDDAGERTLDDLTVPHFEQALARPVIVAGSLSELVEIITFRQNDRDGL
ncbi:MAG: DUF512 domain-containing protein [Anaerolineae bacterium]|nr:DUF512 domain-containing protein [Anaerolineae bacterium]